MPLDPEHRPYAGLWGVISAGTAVKASTAEIWAEVKGAAAEQGITLGAAAFSAVNRMRSIATGIRVAAERFNRAPDTAEMTGRLAAPDVNLRNDAERAILPRWLARFDLTYVNPAGQIQTRTVSVHDVWTPGMTVGELRDAVAEAAEGLAMDYGQGYVGHGNIRPVMI